jgi:hypothetical protein
VAGLQPRQTGCRATVKAALAKYFTLGKEKNLGAAPPPATQKLASIDSLLFSEIVERTGFQPKMFRSDGYAGNSEANLGGISRPANSAIK